MKITRVNASLLITALLVSGCATTSRLKPEQCLSADWQAIGYQDGLLGRATDYITRHAERCSKIGVAPNRASWEQGYSQGLKRYCTPLRAYQLGREGIALNNVCPPDQMLDLLKAHDEGNYYYQLSENWEYYSNGYDPFWRNHWVAP